MGIKTQELTAGDYEALIIKYVKETAGFSPSDIIHRWIDPELTLVNVAKGVNSISGLAMENRLARELPTVRLAELRDLSRLAMVTAFAFRRAPPLKPDATRKEVARAKVVCRRQRAQLTLAEQYGLVTKDEIDALHWGRSLLALANEISDSALMLRRIQGSGAGRITLSTEEIEEALKIGNELKNRIIDAASRRTPPSPEADQCDRLWTLLVSRYDQLRRVGAWLWGSLVDDFVPPLSSRPKPRKPQPASTQVPATATPIAPAPAVAA